MFDLEKEVHAWCASIHPSGWKRGARIAELKDHLFCEIERLSADGLTEELLNLLAGIDETGLRGLRRRRLTGG